MNNKLLKMLLVTTSLSTILLGSASDSFAGNLSNKQKEITQPLLKNNHYNPNTKKKSIFGFLTNFFCTNVENDIGSPKKNQTKTTDNTNNNQNLELDLDQKRLNIIPNYIRNNIKTDENTKAFSCYINNIKNGDHLNKLIEPLQNLKILEKNVIIELPKILNTLITKGQQDLMEQEHIPASGEKKENVVKGINQKKLLKQKKNNQESLDPIEEVSETEEEDEKLNGDRSDQNSSQISLFSISESKKSNSSKEYSLILNEFNLDSNNLIKDNLFDQNQSEVSSTDEYEGLVELFGEGNQQPVGQEVAQNNQGQPGGVVVGNPQNPQPIQGQQVVLQVNNNVVHNSIAEEKLSQLFKDLRDGRVVEDFTHKSVVKGLIDKATSLESGSLASDILKDLKKAEMKEEMSGIIGKLIPSYHHIAEFKNIADHSSRVLDSSSILASSASDDLRPETHSIWNKGFFGKSKLDKDNLSSEYKSEYYGAIIGLDTLVNDKINLGMSISGAKTKLTHDGKEDNASSIICSGYYGVHLTNNFTLSGSLSFCKFDIEGKGGKNLSYNLASGKIVGGYKIDLPGLSLTPHMGIKASSISAPAINKNGATIKAHDVDSIEAIAGLKLVKEFSYKGMSITPEIFGSISHDFMHKKANKKELTIEGSPDTYKVKVGSDAKFKKNIGAGLSIKSGRMEFGGTIDMRFAEKYQNFTGSVKLKVNL
jgi:outer membrane autotransporter protein